MGTCLSSSAEKKAYSRGDDPTQLSLQYQRALYQKQEEIPAKRSQELLERHSSKASLGSAYSVGSVALNQMKPDERDAYLIKRMEKELRALEKRKKFLEKIRDALHQINEENESVDSDVENDKFQDMFRKKIDTIPRQMKKVDNFRLEKLKQYNRASLKRVKPNSSDRMSRSRRASVPLIPKLVGERTREWNNNFAAKLSLVRRFYDWDDIPLEIVANRSGNIPTRSLLAARLLEKSSFQHLLRDDKMFTRAKKKPQTPALPPPSAHKVEVGSDVIEIELTSFQDVSSSDEDEPKKISSNSKSSSALVPL